MSVNDTGAITKAEYGIYAIEYNISLCTNRLHSYTYRISLRLSPVEIAKCFWKRSQPSSEIWSAADLALAKDQALKLLTVKITLFCYITNSDNCIAI